MKIWEKVNNITGNSTKAKFLVEYINSGAKFILAALPEKFLWTVASESEVLGFDSSGISKIGLGSDIAYDKILAVYRMDNGKKRVCAEAPDNSIHIFDEAGSLLRATEMFPKYYKLGGKIYIKPDPDYNSHVGSGNEYQHAYVDLDGTTVQVDSQQGDKVIIIYSAPPVVDENIDSWILTEYENVAIFYAASLDFLRLSSSYRDLCKTQVDGVVGSVLTSYRGAIPSFDATTATDGSSVSVPSKVLNFSISSALPTFNYTENLPTDFDISNVSLPSFNFAESLPSAIDVSSVSLPSSLNITKPLPTAMSLEKSLPGDFTPKTELAIEGSGLDLSVDVSIQDFVLSPPTIDDFSSPTVPGDMSVDYHNFSSSGMNDAISKAENLVDGSVTTNNVQEWLDDEDSEMSQATIGAARQELERASQEISKERTRLENFNGKVSEKIQRFANHLQKYKSQVDKEAQRINSQIGRYQKELDREIQKIQGGVSKYQAHLGKEQQRISSHVARYNADVAKEGTRMSSEISRYQAEVAKESQRYQQDVSAYQAELQKEAETAGVDISKYNALLTKEKTRVETEIAKYQSKLEKASASFNSDLSKYQAEVEKEGTRMNASVARFSAGLQKESQRFTLDVNKYQAELQKSSADLGKDVQQFTLDIQNYAGLISAKSNKFQLDMSKANSYLQEAGTKLQAAGIYTQKSASSIGTSRDYYQRAVGELSAITGTTSAPEQQQASQRREQGSAT